MILLDVPYKHLNMYLNKLDETANILLVQNNPINFSKFKNITRITNLDDLINYNIDIFVINNLKNKDFYENYINNLRADKDIYLVSLHNYHITNLRCIYNKTVKISEITNMLHKTNLYEDVGLHKNEVINTEHIKKDKHVKNVDDKKNVNNSNQLVLKDNNKNLFRKLCLSKLEKIKKYPINDIKVNSEKEAVLIEYRIFPHIEVILRNAILNLGPKWSYTIICGKENYSFMEKMASDIHKNIKVINSNHEFMNQNLYNNFLLTTSFWNLLVGEKILIFQEDSFIFKSNIDDFLQWDYIGAPFSFDCVKPNNVGNGGLSLRSKSIMLEVLNRIQVDKIDEAIFLPSVITYKLKVKLDNIPEDVYFSQILQIYNIGNVADFDTAKRFSSETIYNEDSFGMHCIWHCYSKWQNKLNEYFEKLQFKDHILLEAEKEVYGYLDKLADFCKLMNINDENVVLKNPKEEFRYFCYNYMDYIRMLELPIIKQNEYYEAVLIEFRCLPNLEFLIRNSIYKLGDKWSQTIVCGLNNYEFILNIISNIDRDIKVIKLEYNNLNPSDYNNLFISTDFWNLFIGAKILIYQEDSCIFKSNIDDFLEWDYIGAPWPKEYKINNYNVGNGGFSLRSKNIMLECCKFDKSILNIPKVVKKYMKSNNLDIIPEDVYFTTIMDTYSIGKLADYETAYKFSSESIINNNSFGGHQFWLNNENWKLILYKNVIVTFQPRNMDIIEHRGGWSNVIKYIYKQQLYHADSEIIFYDVLEKDFLWEKERIVSSNKKWFGIVHCTKNTPDYLDIVNISNFFVENSPFLKNIHNCLFLIALAPNVVDYLKIKFNELNIHVDIYLLSHPINQENNIPFFSVDKYIKNNKKKLIHIGQQLRKMTSIYLLNTDLEKLWLTGTRHTKKIEFLFNCECKYLNLPHLDINSISHKYTDTFEEYDNLLSENIVFLDLFDAAANNTILECIIRQTPILVNKLPGTIYYLGEKYPMFFEKLEDIPNLITIENIINTHNYLKTLKTADVNQFVSNIINILNNKILSNNIY
jgi:hypothetical protein